jgi:hypothetical protein
MSGFLMHTHKWCNMSSNGHYEAFLKNKTKRLHPVGFDVDGDLNEHLFDWQRDITRWSMRRGRAGMYEACGLGKTLQQLVFAAEVCKQTGGNVILHCPLGVRYQTKDEADKFGIDVPVTIASTEDDVRSGISLVNYQKIHHFDTSKFAGVVLDESSILKSLDGKTRKRLTSCYNDTPYRLACSATPAPNDYMEIGNQAEFLGVMKREEMLSTFFVHDGGETSKWRLKGHAKQDFYDWLASWCVFLECPANLGYESDYKLPPLEYHDHELKSDVVGEGMLFSMPASTLNERRQARKQTVDDRVAFTADLVNQSSDPWVIWCNLNDEGTKLDAAIPDAIEIAGRHSDDIKEERLHAFSRGDARVLVTKGSICGFGMNWQHCCHTVIYPTDSWEMWHQMVRRFWRFGQSNKVHVHCIISDLESAVLRNIRRKELESEQMIHGVVDAMRNVSRQEIRQDKRQEEYHADREMELPSWLSA